MPEPGTGTLGAMLKITGAGEDAAIDGTPAQAPPEADLYDLPVRKPDEAVPSTPTHVKGKDRSTRITGGVNWT